MILLLLYLLLGLGFRASGLGFTAAAVVVFVSGLVFVVAPV